MDDFFSSRFILCAYIGSLMQMVSQCRSPLCFCLFVSSLKQYISTLCRYSFLLLRCLFFSFAFPFRLLWQSVPKFVFVFVPQIFHVYRLTLSLKSSFRKEREKNTYFINFPWILHKEQIERIHNIIAFPFFPIHLALVSHGKKWHGARQRR